MPQRKRNRDTQALESVASGSTPKPPTPAAPAPLAALPAAAAGGSFASAMQKLNDLDLDGAIPLFDAWLAGTPDTGQTWDDVLKAGMELWKFAADNESAVAAAAAVRIFHEGVVLHDKADDPVAQNHLGSALFTWAIIRNDATGLREALVYYFKAADAVSGKKTDDALRYRIRINIACVLARSEQKKDDVEAIAILNDVLQKLPDSPLLEDYQRGKNTLADMLSRQDAPDLALAAYNDVIKVKSTRFAIEQCRALCGAARILATNGDVETALQNYATAHDLKLNNVALRHNIGNVFLEYGRAHSDTFPKEAKKWFDFAVDDLQWVYERQQRLSSHEWPSTCGDLAEVHLRLADLISAVGLHVAHLRKAADCYLKILAAALSGGPQLTDQATPSVYFYLTTNPDLLFAAKRGLFGILQELLKVGSTLKELPKLEEQAFKLRSFVASEYNFRLNQDKEEFVFDVLCLPYVVRSYMESDDQTPEPNIRPLTQKVPRVRQARSVSDADMAARMRKQLAAAGIPRARWHRVLALISTDNVPDVGQSAVRDSIDTDLNIFVAKLGLALESAKKALEREARNAPLPEGARSRRSPHALTVVRLRATYEALLKDSQLANPSLTEHDRLHKAKALLGTYNRLRKRDSTFHDNSEQLRAARKLLNSLNYQRRKVLAANLVK